ncbi:MAG: C4-dicarboxylate TRAP transporter substrate-binding protein [Hydrogenophaga sp.]|jgi:TRAP-type C4-dicarboxylate transport system substrate-binding protein|uniref:C4-dicarboxylate TRAP transporter substrate-binding protein n=1 Tax=Hydrogenophaga sp. TaxID=1904254 RepID=UPI0025C0A5C7|nr:C4-dicarboxylate TRAP transporter substrate-binding protein [Hydrogenophaga sp.]MDO9504587.1 C4-dicarboxylate TRAP transporter substrate-binding protein [Hydrogenophaga sp.]MDP2986143.1 C4-dicarboxylate TRAP transporter substrate-binding protein [Hydrogenophaga sp.]MDP3202979.1 C4-dicarboxylate TRAP transporter substrate-binding protein [Hydrogenophaga sp.]MDP3627625.1 C4-dicarboxylate TRAP transporter substrate-binding protein [Hydrogenophaga sp.]MDZ4102800.1 C4-dicarboxylate TRAP transpor
MMKRAFLTTALVAALTAAGLGSAHAQQTFKLTIASSHPTTLPWVGLMSSLFVPEVNKRVAALNKGYKIEWREAYGGQLYKMNATLTSVEQGITDIGWVFHNLEAAKMPLSQFGTVTPFTTDDVRIILDVANEMNEKVPALQKEWDRNNMVFLGATGVDTYHLFTKNPIATYADLKGRKISAPGSIGLWLKGSGAVPVDGSLTSYYTDIQTGVSEGTISIATGILPNKIYEVAPYITTVNIGALYIGGMAMNKDSYAGLPPEVQQIVKDVGKEYSKALGATLMQRYEAAIKTMETNGAKQTPSVRVTNMSSGERDKWVKTMPNLAAEWAKTNASKGPAKEIVQTYMDALRKRGVKPARDWDKEL